MLFHRLDKKIDNFQVILKDYGYLASDYSDSVIHCYVYQVVLRNLVVLSLGKTTIDFHFFNSADAYQSYVINQFVKMAAPIPSARLKSNEIMVVECGVEKIKQILSPFEFKWGQQ